MCKQWQNHWCINWFEFFLCTKFFFYCSLLPFDSCAIFLLPLFIFTFVFFLVSLGAVETLILWIFANILIFFSLDYVFEEVKKSLFCGKSDFWNLISCNDYFVLSIFKQLTVFEQLTVFIRPITDEIWFLL
jgi:hypothetical protein